MKCMRIWLQIHADRRGVTALEYALVAALGVVVIIAALKSYGGNLTGVFSRIASAAGEA